MKIGIFDSGVGGLTILKQIVHRFPTYEYIYFGDNAHIPYGNKDRETIYRLTKNAVEFLFKNDAVLIIIACNTATAAALRRLQQEYLPARYPERRILGVVRPVVEAVVEAKAKRIGIIATQTTVDSKSFELEIHKLAPTIDVYQNACPLLVPLIEQGKTEWEHLDDILKEYMSPLLEKGIDSLILGCTHYEHISQHIQRLIGNGVNVVSEGAITASKLADYLKKHPNIESAIAHTKKRTYYVSRKDDHYAKTMKFFLGDIFRSGDPVLYCDLSHK